MIVETLIIVAVIIVVGVFGVFFWKGPHFPGDHSWESDDFHPPNDETSEITLADKKIIWQITRLPRNDEYLKKRLSKIQWLYYTLHRYEFVKNAPKPKK